MYQCSNFTSGKVLGKFVKVLPPDLASRFAKSRTLNAHTWSHLLHLVFTERFITQQKSATYTPYTWIELRELLTTTFAQDSGLQHLLDLVTPFCDCTLALIYGDESQAVEYAHKWATSLHANRLTAP